MKHALSPPPPDFFVVGAAKAGTTAIWSWLRRHDGVFLPDVKEPGFFAFANSEPRPRKGPFDPDYHARLTTDAAAYRALYAAAGDRLAGDVSPVYLFHEAAPLAIRRARPDARIVIVLRDPVERAFSQYLHHMRDGLEPCDRFEAALAAERDRLASGWSWAHGYAAVGHYGAQVRRYLECFPRDQILFLEYRELQIEPAICWRKICEHLGLEWRPVELGERVNATGGLTSVPGRPALSRRLKHPGPLQRVIKAAIPPHLRARLRRRLEGAGRDVPKLTPETRTALVDRFVGERPELEAATALSLDHWFA